MNNSLPLQRNLSNYENFDETQDQITPEVTINDIGRMDEIGIPIFDEEFTEISSPILIRKNGETSPSNSPYENLYFKNYNFKPKSPNTQSPRTRIKTTFAHKNLSPQYFVFPTEVINKKETKCTGIEKQLSLDDEIPMIDDTDLANDLEFRYSKIYNDKIENPTKESSPVELDIEKTIIKNKSFDDVKKELMADIPELEEFEKDLKDNKRDKIIKNITEDVRKMDLEASSIDSAVLDDNIDDLKTKYDSFKEERKKLVAEIHELKCKMSEIRSQEDDILRDVSFLHFIIIYRKDTLSLLLRISAITFCF